MAFLRPRVMVLGTRGIPARHGGFETFAQKLAFFLVQRGFPVSVYCQRDVAEVHNRFTCETWQGVELIHVEVAATGPKATLVYDWYCVRHAAHRSGISLVLGYNGAVFLPYLRMMGGKIMTNMDGIEWRRPKWNLAVRCWFWVNEWIAAWSSQTLIADHPEIAKHLKTRGRTSAMIPYGGDAVEGTADDYVRSIGLVPQQYVVSIARIEPDNNILEIVTAFAKRPRHIKLVVVGPFDQRLAYHAQIAKAASDEVIFAGPIYEPEAVASLRLHAKAYVHGHRVGGTNPSLVEALWAGNPVIAHDNVYNRWTAGDAAIYFDSVDQCDIAIGQLLSDDALTQRMKTAAENRARTKFAWPQVLRDYEQQILALSGSQDSAEEIGSSRKPT